MDPITTETVLKLLVTNSLNMEYGLNFHIKILTQCHRHLRLKWVLLHWNHIPWKIVLFSYTLFCISKFCHRQGDGCARIYHKHYEQYTDVCVNKLHQYGWGRVMTSFYHCTRVVTVHGNLTGQCYWDEMLTPVTDHNVLLLVLTTWCFITTLRLQ